MLKGAQKRMIVVKTSSSRMFEEAYFVMRGDSTTSDVDMVDEANRIIDSCECGKKEKRHKKTDSFIIPILTFIVGSIVGGGFVMAFMMICV